MLTLDYNWCHFIFYTLMYLFLIVFVKIALILKYKKLESPGNMISNFYLTFNNETKYFYVTDTILEFFWSESESELI